jgi:cohesin complex subunit SA-1/2
MPWAHSLTLPTVSGERQVPCFAFPPRTPPDQPNQAFQNLLNLHILFCPPQDSQPEDLPRTSLSLALDEEVQLRCAAFVQTEIESFTEEVAVRSEAQGSDGSGDDGVSGDDDATPKKGGSGRKGKKPANGAKATALAGKANISVWDLW